MNKENEIHTAGSKYCILSKKDGYNPEKLAEAAKISRAHINAIEAPNIIKTFSLEFLFEIAKALDVEPSQLLEFR